MGIRKKQIRIYLGKHFRMFWTKKAWSTFIIAAVISLAVSYVQSKNMFKYNLQTWEGVTVLISACIWIGIFNSVQLICRERGTLKHEHRTGLHMSSYFCSHVIFQTGICFVEAIILLIISCQFLKYPSQALLINTKFEFLITYFLTMLAADVLGLALSSIVKTSDLAMTVMPFILIFELIFSGAFFSVSGPIGKLSTVTICKYSMTAACISANYNTLEDTEKIMVSRKIHDMLERQDLPFAYNQVEQIIDENYEVATNNAYNYTRLNLIKQGALLLLHTLATAIIGIFALEFIDYDKR
nr:ABC transporter permease [uncultured Anaerobutyricum sp.]